MLNWMRPEPVAATVARLVRHGFDGIELSAEPAEHDAAALRNLLDRHGLRCWGGVTRMFGDRDLAHRDPEVRAATVEYVRESLRWVAELGGEVLTVVPAAIGRVQPMGAVAEDWARSLASLRASQETAAETGVRIALEPLNRFETHLVNRVEQAIELAEAVGGDCGVCVDFFHMNIEEADWRAALRTAGGRVTNVHVADNNRRPPGEGAFDWDSIVGEVRAIGYDGCLSGEFTLPADEAAADDAVGRTAAFLRARVA